MGLDMVDVAFMGAEEEDRGLEIILIIMAGKVGILESQLLIYVVEVALVVLVAEVMVEAGMMV